MELYQTMYNSLFRAVTLAIRQLTGWKIAEALHTLKAAQQLTEELYIEG